MFFARSRLTNNYFGVWGLATRRYARMIRNVVKWRPKCFIKRSWILGKKVAVTFGGNFSNWVPFEHRVIYTFAMNSGVTWNMADLWCQANLFSRLLLLEIWMEMVAAGRSKTKQSLTIENHLGVIPSKKFTLATLVVQNSYQAAYVADNPSWGQFLISLC